MEIERAVLNRKIQMVDVQGQYQKIKKEVDKSISEVIDSAQFINGPKVRSFQASLEKYLKVNHVIPCANGTDALQIALMAAGLKPGDEVIVPSFTYVATAEVIALLNLKPVMVDVHEDSFNINVDLVKSYITEKTKAIVPVHLFGQAADMEVIMAFAKRHNLFVIEDNAQAIGADYTFESGKKQKVGTIGHIGCTSFYPSKNLGCYGDGGALFTNDDALAEKIRMIANHGQKKKYHHSVIGVNSRLDSIQAAVLDIKLKRLDKYAAARRAAAEHYDKALGGFDNLKTPVRSPFSSHVFHQYTLRVQNLHRNGLQEFLKSHGIPTMIYYPIPLYKQDAFSSFHSGEEQVVTEKLCQEVLSLPIHTEMDQEILDFITNKIITYFS